MRQSCSPPHPHSMGDRSICMLLWVLFQTWSRLSVSVFGLGANTRELISFSGSGCNGFIPQDLITVRCPMCAGFKHPPARLSSCQLGLRGELIRLPPPPVHQNVCESLPLLSLMLTTKHGHRIYFMFRRVDTSLIYYRLYFRYFCLFFLMRLKKVMKGN